MWQQLHIHTTLNQAEIVSNLLTLAGASAVTLQDAADQPILEPSIGSMPLWEQTQVTALFDCQINLAPLLRWIQNHLDLQQPFHYHIEIIENQVWEHAWLAHFQPMRFGQHLWICPSSYTPPEPAAINILLDPGLAFGTGTHPTTALCLRWLDANPPKQQVVIDYGCGSGILAIAAMKLGARKTIAIDHDPQALEATRNNAEQNQISLQNLIVIAPEEFPSQETADLLLANILAQPLIELAPHFAELIKPNGTIVLSGILETQIESVNHAYAAWFTPMIVTMEEGWACITAIKN